MVTCKDQVGAIHESPLRLSDALYLQVSSLFAGAVFIALLDATLVTARAGLSVVAAAGYLASAVACGAWVALAVGCGTAALQLLASAASRRVLGRRGARARRAASVVGWGVLLGAGCVVLIRPWNLYVDRLATPYSVPSLCVAGTLLWFVARDRLPRPFFAASALLACAAAVTIDATAYRGLYVTLHRALFFVAWQLGAFGLRAYLAGAARGVRGAMLGVALLAQLAAIPAAQQARALGILHGTAQPKWLAVLQAMSDADHDGFSARLGGGDCDDADPRVKPGACETRGDAVDDNCNGGADAPAYLRHDVRRSRRAELPDVYLIMMDTLRADFGGAGGRARRAPRFEAFARGALDFRRAYTTYPSTLPAVTGMVQSRDARYLDHRSPDLLRTLAGAGYDAQLWVAERRVQVDPAGPPVVSVSPPITPFALRSNADKRAWTPRIIDAARAELGAPSDRPRLRWLQLLDAHNPYSHARAGLSMPASYAVEVAFLHAQVARLLDALDASPRGRQAVVVLAADHGEELGEHGAYYHDAFVWETSVHVPLVMRLPGVAPRVVHAPASLIDVWPTLASYLGLDGSRLWQGHDWLASPERRHHPPVAEITEIDAWGGIGRPARQAMIDTRYKLIFNASENLLELYDLAADPLERSALHATQAPAAAWLYGELRRFQDQPDCIAR